MDKDKQAFGIRVYKVLISNQGKSKLKSRSGCIWCNVVRTVSFGKGLFGAAIFVLYEMVKEREKE
jgi:hypothetical protein